MITNIFSKRQKRLRGEYSDVYQYESFPITFRRQVVLILKKIVGSQQILYRKIDGDYGHTNKIYYEIYEVLLQEYGVFQLNSQLLKSNSIFEYFLECSDYERCLDIIELFGQAIFTIRGYETRVSETINEINYRFKEHGIGYQFEPEANEIIRVDSQFVHSEVVKPVLQLLANNELYQGTNDEFLSAHEHYRHQNYKESLNDCLKSFESFLKAIHEKRNWEYNKDKDTAQRLVQSCFDHDLIPKYMQTQFDSLGNLLKSGLPTTRNRESGHGQGTEVRNVPEHLASYALHLTATNLLFLAQCEAKL